MPLAREDHVDPVLLQAVFAAEQRQEPQDGFDRALTSYMRQPDDYDAVLGETIPDKLRTVARKRLANNAYQSGSNSMAAGDFGVFQQIIASPPATMGFLAGLSALDNRLGGLRDLVLIGAEEGVGKTSLLLHFVWSLLRSRSDVGVLLYSLDLTKTRIFERLVCCDSILDYRTLMSPEKTPGQRQQVQEALARVIGRDRGDHALDHHHLRIFAPADYVSRWNAFFGWPPVLTRAPSVVDEASSPLATGYRGRSARRPSSRPSSTWSSVSGCTRPTRKSINGPRP